ncbi:MAG TPA: DUF484 family protein [Methylophilaceae bacterium]|jgi:hypothetical protein
MQDDETLNEDQITDYLRDHPQFFEHHPTLLAEMYLPSLHGNGTVSLAERQQLAQRDRIRVLETKLNELLQFGEENDAIGDKVHRLSLGLLAAQDFDILLQLLTHNLREDFQVPHVGVRLWADPKNSADSSNPVFEPVDSELSSWAQSLVAPYCGHKPGLDMDNWFGDSAAPKSFALVALRGEKVFGLLAMASEEEQRFYPEMGTLYLKRIGELLSAALLRYID